MKSYWRIGEPCVWGTAAALALTLLIAFTLIAVVMINGLGVFWPSSLDQLELKDGTRLIGELTKRTPAANDEGYRRQYKVGNRDLYSLDFRWVDEVEIAAESRPAELVALERLEYGNFYGRLLEVRPGASGPSAAGGEPLQALLEALQQQQPLRAALRDTDEELSAISYRSEQARRQILKLTHQGRPDHDPAISELERQRGIHKDDFNQVMARQEDDRARLRGHTAVFADANGRTREIPLAEIVRVYQPNSMGLAEKSWFYMGKLKELILDEPREANTEGGIFPAIFGTILLIFTMSLFSFPFGVIAAIYLREYAREGAIVRLVRIAVNNLAGIPSIVYGIFGLGFFIYGVGGAIDRLFFPELLPTPTFGTGGLLWASLTLALLTVPVVIVATEEALSAIPREIREGSLALGSTKFQTLMRILLPMASPGIMTGLILAMARAAGEVAPLMITGVVKLAPTLPLDGNFPFFHLDRKFMHLGFHIFDIGFQSPNVEAAKPMVFVTTLLLVLIVLVMSSVAIRLRNKMKKRYTFGTF